MPFLKNMENPAFSGKKKPSSNHIILESLSVNGEMCLVGSRASHNVQQKWKENTEASVD